MPASTKADGTEVTPADIEVEELIRSLIVARFPGDGVTGEELADRIDALLDLVRDVPSGRDYQSLIQARR